MSDDSEDLQIGRIVISYYLPADAGEPVVLIDFPDIDDIPMVTQLGMLEMAKDTLLHPEDDDE